MPTRHMVSLVVVLLAVTYAAISQGNGPAYLPAYTLLGILLVSWMHNWANAQHLEITLSRSVHGFAGGLLLIPFKLRNLGKRTKFGLQISTPTGGTAAVGRLETLAEGSLSQPAAERGRFLIERVVVSTIFPLGIFRARKVQRVACEIYVYPLPAGDAPFPESIGEGSRTGGRRRVAGDDFAGVRNYLPGESQRHVDWRAVARGMPLMIKQFESVTNDETWLDWESLRGLENEARLSQLAGWVVAAERSGKRYGMRLPGVRVEPALGDAHYHACLRALAVWGKVGQP